MRLLDRIKKNRISVSSLAEALGVTEVTVYNWIQDPKKINLGKAELLAKILKCKAEDLLCI